MTTKRALILAGGGLAGIGWETGVLRGIADEAPDTARALLVHPVEALGDVRQAWTKELSV